MTTRRCAGFNLHGDPCGSPCAGADGFCSAHRRGADMRALGGVGGRASGAARRRRSRTIAELVAERLEADADIAYRQIRAALDRGDRAAAMHAVDCALGVTVERATQLETKQAMLDRRSWARRNGSRWRDDDEETYEL